MGVLVALGSKVAAGYGNYPSCQNRIKPSFWAYGMSIVFIVFVLLCAFRYDVGRDYLSYLRDYINGYEIGRDHEFIFHWVTVIFYYLEVPVPVYFGLLAFIQFFFFIYGLKDERFALPLILFFIITNGTFMSWMNGIRQDIAGCIWIFSIVFIVKRQFWKYFLCIVLAMGFHKTAIILLLLYPVLTIEKDLLKSIPLQIILFGSVNILRLFFASYFYQIDFILNAFSGVFGEENAYESYTVDALRDNVDAFVGGTGLGMIFKMLVYFLIIVESSKLKKYYSSHRFNIIYTCFFIGICAQFLFPDGMNFLMRPFRYFTPFSTVVLSLYLYYLFHKAKSFGQMIGVMLIIAYIGLFVFSIIYADPELSVFFRFTFEQPESVFRFNPY